VTEIMDHALSNAKDLPRKDLLRPDEVALFFNVSKATIYRWVDFGRLSASKPSGGTLRIFRESVVELLNKKVK